MKGCVSWVRGMHGLSAAQSHSLTHSLTRSKMEALEHEDDSNDDDSNDDDSNDDDVVDENDAFSATVSMVRSTPSARAATQRERVKVGRSDGSEVYARVQCTAVDTATYRYIRFV